MKSDLETASHASGAVSSTKLPPYAEWGKACHILTLIIISPQRSYTPINIAFLWLKQYKWLASLLLLKITTEFLGLPTSPLL